MQLTLILFLFSLGYTLSWFQTYSQVAWEFWSDKPLLSALIYAIPTSLLFWYGTKLGYDFFNKEAWTVRLIMFAVSYLVFPILTHCFIGETMFTGKTITCVLLSFLIVLIQIFWR